MVRDCKPSDLRDPINGPQHKVMMHLDGAAACSDFRLAKVADELSGLIPAPVSVVAWFRHFIDVDGALDDNERRVLERLLDYGSPQPAPHGSGAVQLLVTPRLGTISPWSTKATDIARHCGLDRVRRIERGVVWRIVAETDPTQAELAAVAERLHDRMTESVFVGDDAPAALFLRAEPSPLRCVDVIGGGRDALVLASRAEGYALSGDEIDYLLDRYTRLGRNPTDAELMMFAQVNSEHCRHKIFNADWTVDGEPRESTLFGMIRSTHEAHPGSTMVAYSDNAAVIEGARQAEWLTADAADGVYRFATEPAPILMKVE
ncbi:MAG: phosphoribosylformylglycinamidine synthase, partial [Proteobacteria bacterium]